MNKLAIEFLVAAAAVALGTYAAIMIAVWTVTK